MEKDLNFYLNELPYEVDFSEIFDFERFEDRFFEISGLFGDILGMNVGSIEFCPNYDPPKLQTEILPFLWVVNPTLQIDIKKYADDLLIETMENYNTK